MDALIDKITEQKTLNLYRKLQEPSGHDFSSNDYLGFASDPKLQNIIHNSVMNVAPGSTGSRLLRGHKKIFADLENKLAKFSGSEEALYFSSGYLANLGLLSALLNETSVVFSDEYNHASIIDGIRLSRAVKKIFKHNDLSDLEKLLSESPTAPKFIVIESLYSMSGDFAPLRKIVELAKKFNALVIVDEAHATGIFGAGLVQQLNLQSDVFATIHTAGKALGVAGAWISCKASLKEFLINFSRPFIYSTAPSPLVCEALLCSLEYWHNCGKERAALCLDQAKSFRQKVDSLENIYAVGDAQIISIILGDSKISVDWADTLQAKGYDVRAIRYPTVPKEKAGLRISIKSYHNDLTISTLIQQLKLLGERC